MATVHDAARAGDVSALLTSLVANPLSINARDRHSRTPLHLAAWAGKAEIVKILCEKRAEIGAAAMDDMAALHFASQKGHLQVVRHLLAAGAYVNACTRKGMTPLHFAVQGGHADVVDLLMKRGARIDVQNKAHKTALDLAKDEKVHAALLAFKSERDAKLEENFVLPMSKNCGIEDRSLDEEDASKKRVSTENDGCTGEKNVENDLLPPKKKSKVEISHLADDQEGCSDSPENDELVKT